MIEDGIVEFMKYRGPVTLVTKVIDRFTKLNLGKNTADVDKDRKIVEKSRNMLKQKAICFQRHYTAM